MENEELRHNFHLAMEDIYHRAKNEANYNANRFIDLVRK
jgi:hypothetical protein